MQEKDASASHLASRELLVGNNSIQRSLRDESTTDKENGNSTKYHDMSSTVKFLGMIG